MLPFAVAVGAQALADGLVQGIARSIEPNSRWRRRSKAPLAEAGKMVAQAVGTKEPLASVLAEDEDFAFSMAALMAFSLDEFMLTVVAVKSAGTFEEMRGHLERELAEMLTALGAEEMVNALRQQLLQVIADSVDVVVAVANLEVPESLRARGESKTATAHLRALVEAAEERKKELSAEHFYGLGELLPWVKRCSVGLLNTIRLPDLMEQRVVDLDMLYIDPTLVNNAGERLRHGDLDLRSGRYAVLGNPGAGKSTLLRRLGVECCAVASLPAPLLINLRTYEEDLDSGSSLVSIATRHLGRVLGVAVPDSVVFDLASRGGIVLLLDGIDELSTTGVRSAFFEALRGASGAMPSLPIITSARVQGFSADSLDSTFMPLVVQDFSNEDIRRYAARWFEFEGDEDQVDQFVRESDHVPDLRTNPLVLALLCVLYSAAMSLPDSRAAVYQKCSELLFREWDKHRGIRIGERFDQYLDEALEELAFTFYAPARAAEHRREEEVRRRRRNPFRVFRRHGVAVDGEPLRSSDSASLGPLLDDEIGVRTAAPESEVVDAISVYLFEWRLGDEYQASLEARDFISFCKTRLWILTQVDEVDPETREIQLGFVHKTFLEYYCGVRISRTFTVSEIVSIVRARSTDASFQAVLEVALQSKERAARGSVSDVADLLLSGLGVDSTLADLQTVLRSVAVRPEVMRRCAELVARAASGGKGLAALVAVVASARPATRTQIAAFVPSAVSDLSRPNQRAVIRSFNGLKADTVLSAGSAIISITDTVRFRAAVDSFRDAVWSGLPTELTSGHLGGGLLELMSGGAPSPQRTVEILDAHGALALVVPFDAPDDRGGVAMVDSIARSVLDGDLLSRLDSSDWVGSACGWLGERFKNSDWDALFPEHPPAEWRKVLSKIKILAPAVPMDWMLAEVTLEDQRGDSSGGGIHLGAQALLGLVVVFGILQAASEVGQTRSVADYLLYSELLSFRGVIEVLGGLSPSDLAWEEQWGGLLSAEDVAELRVRAASWIRGTAVDPV